MHSHVSLLGAALYYGDSSSNGLDDEFFRVLLDNSELPVGICTGNGDNPPPLHWFSETLMESEAACAGFSSWWTVTVQQNDRLKRRVNRALRKAQFLP